MNFVNKYIKPIGNTVTTSIRYINENELDFVMLHEMWKYSADKKMFALDTFIYV